MLVRSLLLPTLASAAAVQLPLLFAESTPLEPLQQPNSSSPLGTPHRKLPWGQVNILSTTDTHGWLMGHQRQESEFSGDWGDLYSFATTLKSQARARGVDLLLVDSGDRVDGNGLVDGEPTSSGQVKGWTAMDYFRQMPYDIVTTGNHELYKCPVAVASYERLASAEREGGFGDRYVTSNVNLTLPSGEEVTMGKRYRKWKTEMGRTVTAFGPLFDFKAHAANISVTPPHLMILEPWFKEAIAEEPNFFLLVGHMSIRTEADSEWSSIARAIRAVHPTTPVLVFGGHHHIRDCTQEDRYSMSLAAGRYMETVGFMSVSGLDSPNRSELAFSRRYLDQNRNTYAYHAGEDFDTPKGRQITRDLSKTAENFNLTLQFGVAPQSYYLYRHPPTSEKSILNLLTSKVLPLLVNSARPDRPHPSVTILNSGSVRFDVFKGPFTRNDQWIILPFTNSFQYIPSVPRSLAVRLLPYLNLVGEHHLASTFAGLSPALASTSYRAELSALGLPSNTNLPSLDTSHPHSEAASVELLYRRRLALAASASLAAEEVGTSKHHERLTPGYVTADSCAERGDDTRHRPIPAVWQPTFVSTAFPRPRWHEDEPHQQEDKVDVVFFDFIQLDILRALNTLSSADEAKGSMKKVWSKEDVGTYVPVEKLTANTLMQEYARREWN